MVAAVAVVAVEAGEVADFAVVTNFSKVQDNLEQTGESTDG